MARIIRRYPLTNVQAHTGGTDQSWSNLYGDPATAWSDGSDATYTESQVGDPNIFLGWAEGEAAQDVTLPDMAGDVICYVHFKQTNTLTNGIAGIGVTFGGTSPVGHGDSTLPVPAPSPGWTAIAINAPAQAVSVRMRNEPIDIEFRPNGDPFQQLRIYEAELIFGLIGGLHPCRQFPRADGLAASSARRNYPPDKSLQASPRHAGVYW